MAKSQGNETTRENQDFDNEFFGESAPELSVDTTQFTKTISTGYCAFLPERAVVNKAKTLLGRIGGTMFGVEWQLRDISKAGKVAPDTHPEEFGRAMTGDFGADRYDDNGEITTYVGGYCYLPAGFHERFLAKFASLSAEEQEAGMTFSVFVYAEPSGNPRGYRYELGNAMRVQRLENELVARLRREAMMVAQLSNNKLLPAPSKKETAELSL